jgi:hypothetical protein
LGNFAGEVKKTVPKIYIPQKSNLLNVVGACARDTITCDPGGSKLIQTPQGRADRAARRCGGAGLGGAGEAGRDWAGRRKEAKGAEKKRRIRALLAGTGRNRRSVPNAVTSSTR